MAQNQRRNGQLSNADEYTFVVGKRHHTGEVVQKSLPQGVYGIILLLLMSWYIAAWQACALVTGCSDEYLLRCVGTNVSQPGGGLDD